MPARHRPTIGPRPTGRRIPAYQLRQRATAPAAGDSRVPHVDDAPAAAAAGGDVEARASDAPAEAADATAEHAPEPTAEPAAATSDLPALAAGQPVEIDGESASPPVTPPDSDGETIDYEEYLRSVEEAAARSRAQRRTIPVVPPAGGGAGTGTEVLPVVATAAAQPAPAADAAAPAAEWAEPAVPPRARQRRSGGRGGSPPRGRGRRAAAREPDPRPRWKRPKTWFFAFLGVFLLLAGTVGAWAAYLGYLSFDAYNDVHVEPTPRPVFQVNPEGTPVAVPTEEIEASLPDWDNQDPFNILLLGIDERPGDDEPARSDTMIVVRVFPATKQVTMMSIPRDTWVYIPPIDSWDKINAAYPAGELESQGNGAGYVMQTIEANFDIRIHYFMTIDFEGFRDVVDTLGGVVIDVRAPVKDDQYPTEDFGLTREYFPTGLQKMDGETALRFARTRHGDNDIARGDRQQQVLMAIREQASVSDLILQANDLIRDFQDSVRTDLSFNQMLALANIGRGIDPNGIQRINLWEQGVLIEHLPEFEGDAFYMEADWQRVYELMAVYFGAETQGPPLPTPTIPSGVAVDGSDDGSSVSLDRPVIVQNASSYSGVSDAVSSLLVDAGLANVSTEATELYGEVTMIYDYAGDPATAEYVAAQLGLDDSHIEYGSGGTGIVVVVGDDLGAIYGE